MAPVAGRPFLEVLLAISPGRVLRGLCFPLVLCPKRSSSKKDSFDRKPNPGMLLRAAEKHGINMKRSIMIGDKDSDMQAARNAGVGIRCHYLPDGHEEALSAAANHKIYSLREGIPLWSEAVAT